MRKPFNRYRAYRKPPSLFRTVPSLTPYDLPFPQNGNSICPQDTQMAISPQRVIRYTSCLVLQGRVFRVGGSNGAISGYIKSKLGGRPPSWIISNGHVSATAHSIHLYSAHPAVIFAITRFSFIN